MKETKLEWYSPSEKVPNEDEEVLAKHKDYGLLFLLYHFDDENIWDTDGDSYIDEEIEYWTRVVVPE